MIKKKKVPKFVEIFPTDTARNHSMVLIYCFYILIEFTIKKYWKALSLAKINISMTVSQNTDFKKLVVSRN